MQQSLEILNNQNALFNALFNYSSEAILVIDDKSNIVANNPTTERLFGYLKGEMIGKNLDILIPQQFKKVHHKHIASYNSDPHPRSMAAGMELFALRKDKSEFPINVSLSPTEIDGKKIVIALVMDITEQENAKNKLRKLNSELEGKVVDRTHELTCLVKELEQKNIALKNAENETLSALQKEKMLNELKSRFVSTASHEFRTPLSTILSSCSLVERYNTPDTLEKKAKHVQKIKKSVKHLTSILNDFLSLDKIEEGRLDLQKSLFNCKKTIEEAIDDLGETLKSGQTIDFNYSGNTQILSDKNVFRNILNNLVSNASKYSNENKTIFINAYINKNLVLQVKDEGIGIPKEEQEHLFERFFRAKNTLNIEGTGLGLHIVKKYVEMLNGSISFESEYMEGTTFTITIPA